MTTHLRFTNFINFEIITYTTNNAGQKVKGSSTFSPEVPCVFLYQDNRTLIDPTMFKEDFIEFVVGDAFEPTYSMNVVNLRDRFGEVIEPGPLEIIAIRKYAGFEGVKHHYRLRTRKLRNC